MSQLGTYNFASIESITGDIGGAVFPVASNINIVGAPGVTVTGNPVTGTLTIAAAGGAGTMNQFTTDVGGPVNPTVGGVVDFNGGYNISTDGSVANRVTFNLAGTTNHAVQVGNATSSLTSLAVGANGETLMGSTGANPGWTSSPQFGGSVTATNDITSTAGSISSLVGSVISREATNTATGPSVILEKVRVAAIIQTGDDLGKIRFSGYDGVGYITGAKITSTSSGTIGVNRVAGNLQFYTHPDSAIALPSEPLLRMTISSAGNVTVATPDAGVGLTVTAGGITATAGDITAASGALSASTTVTGATLQTGLPASVASCVTLNGTTMATDGTGANIDMSLSPKGTGSVHINANTGGSLIFRGISTGGWTNIDWHMEQHVVQTLNATPTAIFTLVLPTKRVVTIKAMVNGFQDDYSDTVGGEILVTAYRDNAGGNIKLVGAPIINVNYTDLIDTSDINAGIDVGTQSINIYAIGVAAQTWNWASTIQYMYTVDNS